jgi:hypothetical protein
VLGKSPLNTFFIDFPLSHTQKFDPMIPRYAIFILRYAA